MYFLEDRKMSFEMVDFCIAESNVDLLDNLLSDFNTLKKFNDYIKVLSFYHVERCEKDDVSQCLFTVNLRYLFTEHEVQEKKGHCYTALLLYNAQGAICSLHTFYS